MNAVFTYQSAGLVRESGVAIAERIGLSFLGGPLGWFLIILTMASLFVKGEEIRDISRWVNEGTSSGPKRTVFLLWQMFFFPVNMVIAVVADLLQFNILHIPLGIIECWRAALEVGLAEVPVLVRSATDLEVLELSLIENLQRADLNPIEEAQAYARLAHEYEMTQEEIGQKVGRSRTSVANAMRLLDLHEQIQKWVVQDLLSVGHAKVLLALKAPEEQLLVAETVLRRSATVRATERLIARQLGNIRPRRRRRGEAAATDAAIDDLQNRLQHYLGAHVVLHHDDKRGRLEIEYYGSDDLQRILNLIGLPASDL
jgi:ParB family chromosome partitioning protein